MTAEATPQTEIGVYLSPRQNSVKAFILNGEPKSIYDIQKEFSEIPNSSLKKDLTYMTRLVQIWKNGTARNTTYSNNEYYKAASKRVHPPKMLSIEAIEADLNKEKVCKKCNFPLNDSELTYCMECKSKYDEALSNEKIKNAYLNCEILIYKGYSTPSRWNSFLQREAFNNGNAFYTINGWSTRIADSFKLETVYVFEKNICKTGVSFSRSMECFHLEGKIDFSDYEIYEQVSNNAE
jgi:hypothetical protein